MKKIIMLGGKEIEVEVILKNSSELDFEYNGNLYRTKLNGRSNQNLNLSINGKNKDLYIEDFESKGFKQVFCDGFEEFIKIKPKVEGRALKGPAAGSLESPMPGKIFKVLKKMGDKVEAGEVILILEAMKMEHSIKATKNGVIKVIFFKEGEQVSGGAELCSIE